MRLASAMGQRDVRALQRHAQRKQTNSANKPLQAGKINEVSRGLKASSVSMKFQSAYNGYGYACVGVRNHRIKAYEPSRTC